MTHKSLGHLQHGPFMPTLFAVTESIQQSGDQYLVSAPEDWSQGRTLYGGMTTALCAVVAQRALTNLPPLRSAQISFVGPASGQLHLTAATLRQGKSSTIVSVDCVAGTGLAARALFTYGAGRTSQIAHDLTAAPTSLPSPQDCAPFFPPAVAKTGFFQNFEMKLAAGLRPMSGGGAPEFTVWVRHLDDGGVDPVVALLALADSLPPAAMIQFPAPAPISTMTWMIDLFQPIARGGGWYLLRSRSEQAAAGYSFQAMDVWDEQGRRVAMGRQVVALFT
jgi:acyl-CoA thioesterase